METTGRYVPKDYARWSHVDGCAWCGRRAGNAGQSHELVTCLACGVPQCKSQSECQACLVGWLPGWSRGCNIWQGARNVSKECGYKGCSGDAVAKAPRVGRACAAHLSRAKDRGTPLSDVIAQARAEAVEGTGGYTKAWRHMTWRSVDDSAPPVLPAIGDAVGA